MSNDSGSNPQLKNAKYGFASPACRNSADCGELSWEHECFKHIPDDYGVFRAEPSISDVFKKKASHFGSNDARGCLFLPPSVAGILQKWVNIGKGWRSRWFVLHDGVLSYYKVHGLYEICLNHEVQRGLKLIGDKAHMSLRRHKNSAGDEQRLRRAFGQIHLKVASLRESKSDDKKFHIFTGTRTLHLLAEHKEDRARWLDALKLSKELFPGTFCSALLPSEDIAVLTEKLSARLREEGVSKETIRDCEDIVRSEFSKLQQQLCIFKQKRLCLINDLKLLEVISFQYLSLVLSFNE